MVIERVLRLNWNHSLSFAEMVSAGRYDYVGPIITPEHFPFDKDERQKIDVVLFHSNTARKSEEVIARIGEAGYRPVTLLVLLAIGATRPEFQREFPIVALGSYTFGLYSGLEVPYIWGSVTERRLHTCYLFRFLWLTCCRFAAVRVSP